MSLIIRGGRIIDPGQGIDQVGDVLIAEGKIIQAGGGVITSASLSTISGRVSIMDAAGLVVCPGFVDLHCHLREPGFEDKETIATGTKAAATGGFAAACCMANTEPPLDSPSSVTWLKERANRDGLIAVLPIGCLTEGRRGRRLANMEALAEAGVVAFSDDGNPVAGSRLMRRAMERSRELCLPVVDHCEDSALSDGGIINEGEVSARLGLRGIPAASEEIMVARDLILAGLTGARLHIAHVSTGGSLELIRRAKEDGIPVTAEVTPHHLTLTEESILRPSPDRGFDTNAKVNPPLRTQEDVEALIQGLKDGVIDAIATDHAPHTLADKNCELQLAAFGISGFETAFGCLMGLVHLGEISIAQLISKLTCGPASVIGRGCEFGSLKAGTPANICILDPDHQWTVDSSRFASKGKNTPYQGRKFRGKVMATVAGGKMVYMDPSLRSRLGPKSGHLEPTSRDSEHTSCHSEHSEESNG
ncbi:MAG: dihydroorotase [Dehalococcoidia bacterium]|nr:dihydroorotase [Dehalococcoidia bacterium]